MDSRGNELGITAGMEISHEAGMSLVKRTMRNGRRVCYVCRVANETVSHHHVIPRAEGGLPLADNIVYLCEVHHNLVEGPYGSFYGKDNGWNRIYNAKHDWEAEHRPQPKAHLDCREPATEPTLKVTKEQEQRNARIDVLCQRSRKGWGAFFGFYTKSEQDEYFAWLGLGKLLATETEEIAA